MRTTQRCSVLCIAMSLNFHRVYHIVIYKLH